MMETPGIASKGKKTSPKRTIRFTLELEQTTESDFPEFSYAELLEKAKSSERNKLTPDDGDLDRKRDEDEQREIEQIAARMEAKYGGSKRRIHDEDYVDVGLGYDETDPFVDNSEAHDDFVPFHLEPQHGGFYVNSGELYFFTEQKAGKSNGNRDDNGEDDDDDFQKNRKAPKLFKLKPPKTRKGRDGKFEPRQKKAKIVGQVKTTQQTSPTKVKKAVAKDHVHPDKTIGAGAPTMVTGSAAGDVKKPPVVLEDWPCDFPASLRNEIEEWKQDVLKDNAISKPPKQFQPCYNSRLIKIGRQTLALKPKKYQTRVYEYLSSFLPATKGTLLKRLKDLLSAEHKELIKELLEKLKLGIENCMPAQIAKYEEAKKTKINSQEKFTEDDLSDVDGESGIVPLKRFEWTDELKESLCSVVCAKIRAIREINRHLVDPPAQIQSFLREEVKVLWPDGWMNSRILYEASRNAHDSFTQLKVKKKKDSSALLQPKPKASPATMLSAAQLPKLGVPLGSSLSQHSYSLPASSTQPPQASSSPLSQSPPSIFMTARQPLTLPPSFFPQSTAIRLVSPQQQLSQESQHLKQSPQQQQQPMVMRMPTLFRFQMSQGNFQSSVHPDQSKSDT